MKHSWYRTGAVALGFVFATNAGAQSAVTGNAFNPALSVILDGQYAHYSRDPADYGIAGFLLGDEAGLAPQGLALGESELAASANVDDRFYGQLTVSLASKDSGTDVNIEEAFMQTTALSGGVTLKAGRFFSDIGYLNSKHSHTWDFVDQPLAYAAMLNGQFGDDGVQLRWVAPTDLLVEVGGEAFRGAAFPAGGAAHSGVGAWTAFAHVGGDVSAESSWRGGVSFLHANATDRESALANGDTAAFSGASRLWIADFIWKWAEHGNPRTRNFVVQGEYLRRQESGDVVDKTIDYATAALPPGFVAPISAYSGTQQGFYVQAAYQFMPRWRVGLRYDHLTSDNRAPSLGVVTPLDGQNHDPSRVTAMMDFSNSEFSRLRVQVARDRSLPQADTQAVCQYIMSIGAHGAHQF